AGNTSCLQGIKTSRGRRGSSSNANITSSNERSLAQDIAVKEKDIALDLPLSTLYTVKTTISAENPLLLSTKTPPKLTQLPSSPPPVAIESPAHAQNYSVTTAAQNNATASSMVASQPVKTSADLKPATTAQSNAGSTPSHASSTTASQDPLAK